MSYVIDLSIHSIILCQFKYLKEKLITKPKFSALFLEDAGKFATTEGRERQNRLKPVKDLKMLVEREGGEEGGSGIVRAAI